MTAPVRHDCYAKSFELAPRVAQLPPQSKSPDPHGKPLTYRDAGVDIDAGNALVEKLGPLAAKTKRAGGRGGLGGFGGLFDLKAAGFTDPILVAANDDVGTKHKSTIEYSRNVAIGIDLVSMSSNELVEQGAEPLVWLDYFASGKH